MSTEHSGMCYAELNTIKRNCAHNNHEYEFPQEHAAAAAAAVRTHGADTPTDSGIRCCYGQYSRSVAEPGFKGRHAKKFYAPVVSISARHP